MGGDFSPELGLFDRPKAGERAYNSTYASRDGAWLLKLNPLSLYNGNYS